MSDQTITMHTALALGDLLGMMDKRVRWMREGDAYSTVQTGMMRHVVSSPETAAFPAYDDNILDCFVRISSTMEHFIPVTEALRLVDNGYLVED